MQTNQPSSTVASHQLIEGFYKLPQIIGNPKANPPIPALIPISRTTFLNGIKSGAFPAPIKLGARSVAWRVSDIKALVEKLGA